MNAVLTSLSAAVGSAAGLLAVGGVAFRTTRHLRRNIHAVAADWFGEEPRPGFEGRAGIPARVTKLEHQVVGLEQTVLAAGARRSA